MSVLSGVCVAAVTPRRNNDEIHLGATWELIDFLCSRKVNGIVLMGSTGEFVHFPLEERAKLIGLAVKRSRVPVVVNVSHSTLDGTVLLAREAADSGAKVVLVMPPYFFRYSQENVKTFYEQFAEQADLRIPALLYNIPIFANDLPAETAAPLLTSGLYAGVKDSSGSWENFQKLKALRSQIANPVTLMMGNDGLYSRAYCEGVDGVISGCACAIPELLIALERALAQGASELITRYELRLKQFIDWIDCFPVPIGIREAVAARGIKVGPHAVGFTGEGAAKLGEFREWFRNWLPIVEKECEHA